MMSDQAVLHVPLRTARADVFRTREVLTDEAVHLSGDLTHARPLAYGDEADARQDPEREQGEDEERRTREQALARDDDQHTDEQDDIAEHVHHETREEVRERGDVAVDALDELACGAC